MKTVERKLILTLKEYNNTRLHPSDILTGREFRRMKRKKLIYGHSI